jgi:hypothetical protein
LTHLAQAFAVGTTPKYDDAVVPVIDVSTPILMIDFVGLGPVDSLELALFDPPVVGSELFPLSPSLPHAARTSPTASEPATIDE